MAPSRISEVNTSVFEKFSPVTGEKLGEWPIGSKEDVNVAVARARKAFPAWRDTPLSERLKFIRRVGEVLAEDVDYFAKKISEDTGKPPVDAVMTELLVMPLFIEYFEKTAPRLLSRKRVRNPLMLPLKKSYIEHFPMGIIGIISPWNFPFQLSVVPIMSALVAGNTVILKPSEVTPITGDLIEELFDRVGLPEGVLQVIQGDGSTGAALTESLIDKIFFTGSVATGRKVMAAAAKRPIPVELELGGKDAFIVCHDAPLQRAAKAAVWGGLLNCGQACTSVERILVVDAVYDRFVKLLLEEVRAIRVGPPSEDPDMGPMCFAKQLKVVEAHIKDAVAKGAKISFGGNEIEGAGQYFEPTVVEGVTTEMDIYLEETFGPVLPIMRVKSEEEAIRLANDHQYGLNASIWTLDVDRGLTMASKIEAGQVTINDILSSVGNPVLPFGGVKNSGIGRYHGEEGILGFTHTRAIMADYGRLSHEPFWFPYKGKYPEMSAALKAIVNGNIPRALLAMLRSR